MNRPSHARDYRRLEKAPTSTQVEQQQQHQQLSNTGNNRRSIASVESGSSGNENIPPFSLADYRNEIAISGRNEHQPSSHLTEEHTNRVLIRNPVSIATSLPNVTSAQVPSSAPVLPVDSGRDVHYGPPSIIRSQQPSDSSLLGNGNQIVIRNLTRNYGPPPSKSAFGESLCVQTSRKNSESSNETSKPDVPNSLSSSLSSTGNMSSGQGGEHFRQENNRRNIRSHQNSRRPNSESQDDGLSRPSGRIVKQLERLSGRPNDLSSKDCSSSSPLDRRQRKDIKPSKAGHPSAVTSGGCRLQHQDDKLDCSHENSEPTQKIKPNIEGKKSSKHEVSVFCGHRDLIFAG